MTDVLEADPFAADPLPRDQYGRPLIIPVKKRGGQPDLRAKLVGYTRVSTFAGSLSDPGGLIDWRLRHLALGLGRNEELAAMAGVFGPTLNDCSRSDKLELDSIIEQAHARSGGNVKADHGTAVHGMTEPDRDPFVPDRMAADVASYHAALAVYGIEVVSTEQFVVCDSLQVAGTFDHLYRLTRDITLEDGSILPAGLYIGDKKTGSLHFDSQSIQLAVYAYGKLYNSETGERAEHGASQVAGLLMHIPKGEGETRIYRIDLVKGWAAAQLAGKVRAHRSDKTLGQLLPLPEPGKSSVDRALVPNLYLKGTVEPIADWVAPNEPDPFDVPEGKVSEAQAAAESTPVTTHSAVLAQTLQAGAAQRRDIAAECAATEAAIKARRAEVEALEAVSADADETAVMAALAGIGAVEIVPIMRRLNQASSRDELAQVWHDAKAEGLEWTPAHTAVLQSRAKTLAEASP